MVGQLLVEQASVGQAGEAVQIGFGPQFFAARSLLDEQCLELFDHLVHRQHHPFQFRRARQFRQAEKLAFADGLGLSDHAVEWAKLPAQHPSSNHGAEQPAQQQPDQAAEGAVPELGQGELRIAQYFDPCQLFPAAHDQGIATFRAQVDQVDEPVRHTVDFCRCAAFHQGLLILEPDDADAAEIAAVENRTDHQLHHCRVIDLCRQRQPQRGGRVLGVGAQLAERLFAGAFQAGKKTAAERHQQEQADCQEQLFTQCHASLLAKAVSRRRCRTLRPASFSTRPASATAFSSRCCAGRRFCPAGTGLRH
ncbi:hypothetical protein D3C81_1154860 [compost metagenome]